MKVPDNRNDLIETKGPGAGVIVVLVVFAVTMLAAYLIGTLGIEALILLGDDVPSISGRAPR